VATLTGGATLQGFTAVFGLFSVPAAAARPAAQLPSTLDATPAGLAAYLQTRPKLPSAPAGNPAGPGPGGEAVPTVDEVAAMPVKALKQLIARAQLSHGDCVEKPELVARALEAAHALGQRSRLATAPATHAL
jgi:hypothetical protein